MIEFKQEGSFKNMEAFLQRAVRSDSHIRAVLEKCGADGVAALSAATPTETSLAARSWGYEVVKYKGGYSLYWTNSDIEDGFPVVIMLQYGHGTGNGGYVRGKDFINPAIKPIFDRISRDMWKVVK